MHQFIASTRQTLIVAKRVARNSFIATKDEFREDPNGREHADALYTALEQRMAMATREQYLKSLSEWIYLIRLQALERGDGGLFSPSRGDQGMLFITLEDFSNANPNPQWTDARIRSSRWPGLNDATRNNLRDNYGNEAIASILGNRSELQISFHGRYRRPVRPGDFTMGQSTHIGSNVTIRYFSDGRRTSEEIIGGEIFLGLRQGCFQHLQEGPRHTRPSQSCTQLAAFMILNRILPQNISALGAIED